MLVAATFNSVWDGGYVVSTDCTIDVETGVVEPDSVDADDVEVLDHEYVELNGIELDVFCNENNEYVISDMPKFQSIVRGV